MIPLLLALSFNADSLLNQPMLDAAQVSVAFFDLNADTFVYVRNHRKVLIPASNMKILTTAAALHFLGGDFRFTTILAQNGAFRQGTLRGDLVLIGGADPDFDLPHLRALVQKVSDRGIIVVDGDIVVVDDYFTEERLPVGWAWHYLDARYGAEISALSLHKNCVTVKIQGTSIDSLAVVEIEPRTDYVRVQNTMKTRSNGDSIVIYRKPEANLIYVDGAIGQGRRRNIDVAVKDPAFFAGFVFREELRAHGVTVTGDIVRARRADVGSGSVVIDSVLSPPLDSLVVETNRESENLNAEILVKTLGAEVGGTGSFSAGLGMVKRFLRLCTIDTNFISIWDGSGLSRHNLVASADIVAVLTHVHRQPGMTALRNSLPAPGEGTLKYRFEDFPAALRAKTGSIHAVSTLSGYLTVAERPYCFSMLFNNFTCPLSTITDLQESLLTSFVTAIAAGH